MCMWMRAATRTLREESGGDQKSMHPPRLVKDNTTNRMLSEIEDLVCDLRKRLFVLRRLRDIVEPSSAPSHVAPRSGFADGKK